MLSLFVLLPIFKFYIRIKFDYMFVIQLNRTSKFEPCASFAMEPACFIHFLVVKVPACGFH